MRIQLLFPFQQPASYTSLKDSSIGVVQSLERYQILANLNLKNPNSNTKVQIPRFNIADYGVVIHVNFNFDNSGISFDELRQNKSEAAIEKYWDTETLTFARHNIWVKEKIVNGQSFFIMRFCLSPRQNSLPLISVPCDNLDDAVEIANTVARSSVLRNDMKCFAELESLRYQKDPHNYVDVMKLAPDAFYVVETVTIPMDEEQPSSSTQLFYPARSKLMEFLRFRNPGAYKILEENKVISGEFVSELGKNLFRFNPFRLSSWEEVELGVKVVLTEDSIDGNKANAEDMKLSFQEYLENAWKELQEDLDQGKHQWIMDGLSLK